MCLPERFRVFLGVAGRVLVCYYASAEYRYHVCLPTIFTALLCRSPVTTWIICLHFPPKFVRMLDSPIASICLQARQRPAARQCSGS